MTRRATPPFRADHVGLQSATDGEFRREQWHADFLYAIPGIQRGALGAPLPVYRRDGQITWTPNATEVTDRVHLETETPIFGDHFSFLAADMKVAIHMCRGNYQSAWFSSGGYDFVAEDVFGALAVDGLFLEYDDERLHRRGQRADHRPGASTSS
jgi:methionine synthase II (cobalamin-independent)